MANNEVRYIIVCLDFPLLAWVIWGGKKLFPRNYLFWIAAIGGKWREMISS